MSPPDRQARRRTGPAPLLLALPLLLLLAIPVVGLAFRITPDLFIAELQNPETLSAIVLSLVTTTVALVVTIIAGTPLAFWLSRSHSRLAGIAETLTDLPTVLPPSVAGVALLLTFGRSGLIGGWLESMGLGVAFTPAAVVLAQVFVASPYYVRAARAGFASVSSDTQEAATIDGASSWGVLRFVLLPQAAPSLWAGAVMCWGRAVGEFGATILFAGNLPGRTQTMPLAVYLGFESGLDRALVLSSVLLGLALVILLVVRLNRWRLPEVR